MGGGEMDRRKDRRKDRWMNERKVGGSEGRKEKWMDG